MLSSRTRLVGVVRRVPLPGPLDALDALADRAHPFLRLVAAPGFRGAPFSVLGVDPGAVLRVGRPGRGRRILSHLDRVRPRPVAREGPRLPFAGGWAGMLGYEARTAFEGRPPPRRPPLGLPALWLGRYDAVLAWDHRGGGTFAAGLGPTREAALAAAEGLAARARRAAPAPGAASADLPRARVAPERFREAIAAAREAVAAGDIFQANVSQRFDARLHGCSRDLFRRLVHSQPAPYMTYLDLGRGQAVLSASPERFLRVVGGRVETDPMKGTRPRGADAARDEALRRELEGSEKERAELAMIVDLARNDLARTCRPGSVRVVVPRRLLRFARVHQAIGVVRGRLRDGLDGVDAVAAAFPPGSVTGAPKVRAMEVIDELEGEGRGPYCGALGVFDAGGDLDLAVAIRTIVVSGTTASYRVGGGITLRSEVEAEWRESLAKGRGLFAALAGQEDAS